MVQVQTHNAMAIISSNLVLEIMNLSWITARLVAKVHQGKQKASKQPQKQGQGSVIPLQHCPQPQR